MSRSKSAEAERAWRAMRVGALLFVLGYIPHFVDHFVRGINTTPTAVLLAGSLGTIPAIVAIVLVVKRNAIAPLLAFVTGVAFAIAYPAVHVPPKWGPFSEPLRAGTSVWDWMSVAASTAGSLAFALAAVYALRLAAGPLTRETAARQQT